LKAIVENMIAFFYPGKSCTGTHAPQMRDSLPSRLWEIILANMKQLVRLTLEILKSLYPRADLDVTSEGFVATCSDEEALKLIKDSVVTVGHIIDMLPVDIVSRIGHGIVILNTLGFSFM
jgi:hypothetical protein